jgi:hypothetical protein
VVVLARLKALVVVGDGLEDYGDLLAVGRAKAKCAVDNVIFDGTLKGE